MIQYTTISCEIKAKATKIKNIYYLGEQRFKATT